MSFTINADSVPVLDDYGWSDYWTLLDWETWVTANVQQYGLSTAQNKFKSAWMQQDILASPWSWGKYDADFRDFLEPLGLLDFITNPIANLFSGAGDLISGVGSGLGNVGGVIDNTSSSVNTFSKYLNWFLPALLVLGIIYLFLKFKK
jgi:hypothetical protein